MLAFSQSYTLLQPLPANMATAAPTQYDRIADAYSKLYPPNLDPSPFLHARLEEEQFRHAIQDPSLSLTGKNVLDLAGGNGHYAFRWLAWGGAAQVTSADISDGMAARGRRAAAEQGIGEERLRFVAADATREGLVVQGAPFDVVTAAWLLNYAEDFEALERMWMNVGRQLKPGGVFVGLLPPPLLTNRLFEGDLLEAVLGPDGVWGRYGTGGKVLGKTSTGYKVEIRLGMVGQDDDNTVNFENYHIRKDVLEDSLRRTGLFGALEWRDWVVSEGLREEYPDLADDATLMPHCRICVARRLS
jgi:ubiquinone/menaquinone biosynthesis C-methylase UbiE